MGVEEFVFPPAFKVSVAAENRNISQLKGNRASGRELISLLDKKSPKNESDPVSLKE